MCAGTASVSCAPCPHSSIRRRRRSTGLSCLANGSTQLYRIPPEDATPLQPTRELSFLGVMAGMGLEDPGLDLVEGKGGSKEDNRFDLIVGQLEEIVMGTSCLQTPVCHSLPHPMCVSMPLFVSLYRPRVAAMLYRSQGLLAPGVASSLGLRRLAMPVLTW